MRNLESGVVALVSRRAGDPAAVPEDASYYAAISRDGASVAFDLTDGRTGRRQLYLRDLATGAVTLVSATAAGQPGNESSSYGQVGDGGRYVAFRSSASDLAPGDRAASGSDQSVDVFLRDTVAGTTRLLTRSPAGTSGDGDSYFADISDDGARVSFWSGASDLVPALRAVRARAASTSGTRRPSPAPTATKAPTWSGAARVGQVLRAQRAPGASPGSPTATTGSATAARSRVPGSAPTASRRATSVTGSPCGSPPRVPVRTPGRRAAAAPRWCRGWSPP